MQKILVAIDASPVTPRVLDYVVGLQSTIGLAEIHLLHVAPLPDVYGETPFYADRMEADEAQKREFAAILDPAVKRLTDGGATVTPHAVTHDSPSEIIASTAAELGVDTIVMGSRGRSALANLFLGSVATGVLAASTLPVVLLR